MGSGVPDSLPLRQRPVDDQGQGGYRLMRLFFRNKGDSFYLNALPESCLVFATFIYDFIYVVTIWVLLCYVCLLLYLISIHVCLFLSHQDIDWLNLFLINEL